MRILFVRVVTIKPNGPAIKGGCVTWRSHPATGPGTLAGSSPGASQVWRTFCLSWHNVY